MSILLVTAAGSAAASGGVCMGVVIDYGTKTPPFATGAPPPPVTQGVSVAADSTSDEEALAAAGDAIDANPSGLICALNSYPSNADQNCLRSSNGSFYYWSYWQGDPFTNTWTYASEGASSHTVAAGTTYVEGWRYQDPGPANPNAFKPSVSPADAFASACPGVTAVPNAKKTTPPPSVTPTTVPSGPTATAIAPNGGGSTAGSKSGTSSPPTSSSKATATTTAKGASGWTATPSSTTTSTLTSTFGQPHHPASTKAALQQRSTRAGAGTTGGGSTLPIVLVIIVVVLLGVGVAVRWRRGPATEE